ncbi:insulin-like growth factor 2 mRNA-binding protein 2 isoform X2 [Apostichopus japonicus]|uniref:insulin-like growth factor 2 mRNA-binding protein 2 isoform X2 n=1 Tax=Stichopus japonicus TaxID=307972 RepID=UPI003AB6AB00
MHWLVHADIPHTAENQPGFSGPLFPLCNQLSVLDPSSYFRRIFGRRHNIKMSKVYIGNLSLEVTEKELRNLFEQKAGITAQEISMKDGFAFVDVENNDLVEQAIEKLNELNLLGSVISVQPSLQKKKKPRSSAIIVHNIPPSVDVSVIETLLDSVGEVLSCNKGREGENGYSVQVRFSSPEEARKAIEELNKHELEGNTLRVKYRNPAGRNGRNPRQNYGGPGGNREQGSLPPDFDFPVRLLVPSDAVGAIIGKGGETIRKITEDTNAKVDIHRRENPGSTEKAVTLNGRPSEINAAVRRIIEIMVEEAQKKEKSEEIPLKILVHNNLVGRLIGRGGKSLKQIMEGSKAKVTVSPFHELTVYNPERTVCVYGSTEQCSKAEEQITSKLRKAYENFLQTVQPHQPNMFPGLNHMSSGLNHMGSSMFPSQEYSPNMNPYQPPGYMNGNGSGPMGQNSTSETVHLYIPKESVGPIIGLSGENIRISAKRANASIKISEAESETATERQVVIKGTPESQYKAQYDIFEKIRRERLFKDREFLRSEILVPKSLVGRIIGRGGVRVRELQRVTGASIDVPPSNPMEENGGGDNKGGGNQEEEEVLVTIEGPFFAIQSAQLQIRKLRNDVMERQTMHNYNRNVRGYRMGRGGRGGGRRPPNGRGNHDGGPMDQ